MGLCFSKNDDLEYDNGQGSQQFDDQEKQDANQIEIEDEDPLQNRVTVNRQTIQNPRATLVKKVRLEDFLFIKVLGRGSFGKVMLVQLKGETKYYAMKILSKQMIEKRNQRVNTRNERQILANVVHPFIVQLHFAFQTKSKLYLIMDFVIGGELFFHLRRSQRFQEPRAKFYAAELVIMLEYLHSRGIAYRDLKPENILIESDGHLKLTDFGLAKSDLKEGETTLTFCGTPEYLAPEILLAQGHNQCVDWWSLGAILYEMLSGAPPFYNKDKQVMFRNRLEKPIEMKSWFSVDAQSIIKQLLNNNPNERLGAKGAQEVKSHQFFAEVNWDALYQKQIEPPFKPKVLNQKDLRHFDQMFTDEPVQDTPIPNKLNIDTYDKFTYQKQLETNEQNTGIGASDKFIQDNPNFSFKK